MTTNVKLMVVFGKMVRVFQESLGKNLEELGMPFSLYPILAHLNEVERAKTQKLGEVAVITSGTITHSVNKLIQLGYVEKVQDEKDKRVFWVQITEVGRHTFLDVHKKHMTYLDQLLKDFSEADKLALIEQIKYFGKGIETKLN
jgi:DNA-binding MarR family transcriptional regulator